MLTDDSYLNRKFKNIYPNTVPKAILQKFDVGPSKKYTTRENVKFWNFYNVYNIPFEGPKLMYMWVYLPRIGAKQFNVM